MKKLLLSLFIVLSVSLSSGCVAKSSYVNKLAAINHETLAELRQLYPENAEIERLERELYLLRKEDSSLINKNFLEKGVGILGGLLSKFLGFDVTTILYTLLGLGGLGGAEVGRRTLVKYKRRRKEEEAEAEVKNRKKMDALASMNPEEANKIKDVL